ncbi:MAG: M48 family metalloprotease [Planctomycetota bacterium]
MNFFDHQDAARKATRRLVVIFVLSIVGVIAVLYAPVAVVLTNEAAKQRGPLPTMPWWDPAAFACIAGAVSAVILLGAGVKRLQLTGGGKAVAESLGGAWVNPAGASPAERRLLDVVEEMSIASGMPVPPVYLIEDESINAFAAGTSPRNAVLGFTRGAVDRLTRDELQGVVAHEFSHVAHGDMRLNIRLACAVAGVMVIALIGRVLLQAVARAPRSRSKKEDGGVGIALVGVLLIAVGSLGAFFGRILQAAVSRQREYLADASAAQYTRNPGALADALRRIAGIGDNRMAADAAGGLNHFFFTSAVNTWLATHPPIAERIRRLEGAAVAPVVPSSAISTPAGTGAAAAMGIAGASSARPGSSPATRPDQPANASGATTPIRSIENVRPILKRGMSKRLLEACGEPYDAQAVLLLLAWGHDEGVRERQREIVRAGLGPPMTALVSRLRPAVTDVHETLHMVMIDLCMPAMQQLSRPQYTAFRTTLAEVMRADGRVNLLEWAIRSVLARRIETRFGGLRDPVGRLPLAACLDAARTLVSTVAWAGERSRVQAAYLRGADLLRLREREPLDANRCSLDAIDQALERLAHLDEASRHAVVQAVSETVSEDALLQPREHLLLRGIADRLNVLVPSAVELLDAQAPGAAIDRRS